MSRDLGTVGFSVGNAGHLTAAIVTCGDTARSQTVGRLAYQQDGDDFTLR